MQQQVINFTRYIAAIFMVVAVLFSVFSASDIHAEEIYNAQISQIQIVEASHDNEKTSEIGHIGGICFHSSCHHNNSIYYQAITLHTTPLLKTEIIETFYIAPPSYDLSSKLIRPPRN